MPAGRCLATPILHGLLAILLLLSGFAGPASAQQWVPAPGYQQPQQIYPAWPAQDPYTGRTIYRVPQQPYPQQPYPQQTVPGQQVYPAYPNQQTNEPTPGIVYDQPPTQDIYGQPVPQPAPQTPYTQPPSPNVYQQAVPQPQPPLQPGYNQVAPSGGDIWLGNPAAVPAPVNVPVLVALLVPQSDRRAAVRRLAEHLEQAASLVMRQETRNLMVIRAYDTAGDPARAAEAAQKAIDDGARLIIGPLFSGSVASASPVAASRNVPIVAFTTDRAVLRNGVWSIGFLPESEVARILRYASSRGLRRIGVLAPDSPYGVVVDGAVRRAAREGVIDLVHLQPFLPEFEQLRDAARAMARAASDADAIFIAAGGQTLQGLAAYLAYNDILPQKTRFLGPGLWEDEATTRDALLRGGWFAAPDPDSARALAFEEAFAAEFGEEPDPLARLGHDAALVAAVLVQPLARDRTIDPFSEARITDAAGFVGASGFFRFLPDGGNERGLAVLKVASRSFETIDPAPERAEPQNALPGAVPPRRVELDIEVAPEDGAELTQ